MENLDGLEFLLSHYAEILFQLAETFDSVFRELRVLNRWIFVLTNKLFSLSPCMDSADPTFHDIFLSSDLLKNHFERNFEKLEARLKEQSFAAGQRKSVD